MRYTPQHLRFLAYGYRLLRLQDLTEAFNTRFNLHVSKTQVMATLKNHRIRCGRPRGNAKGSHRAWTSEQVRFIREGYRRMNIRELTGAVNEAFGLNKTETQVRALTHNSEIRSGRTGRFEKGTLSWNTGTRGIMKPNSGTFKKGDVPATVKQMGAERINVYGYIEIKVDEPNPYTGNTTRYRYKHRVVWESLHGPIPDGHVVSFKDGDKLNCHPKNLQLLSRGELGLLNKNGYSTMPLELRPAMVSTVRLLLRANQIERDSNA